MSIKESHKFLDRSCIIINYLDTKDNRKKKTLDVELVKDEKGNITYKDFGKCTRELSMHLVWYTTYIEITYVEIILYLEGVAVRYDRKYQSNVLLDTAIIGFLEYMNWTLVANTIKKLSSKLRELDFKILSRAQTNMVVVRFINLTREECIEELQEAGVTEYIGYRNCLYFQVYYNDKLREMKHSVLLGTINNM